MLVVSDNIWFQAMNLFLVTVRNILSYGLIKFVGLHVFILIHPKED